MGAHSKNAGLKVLLHPGCLDRTLHTPIYTLIITLTARVAMYSRLNNFLGSTYMYEDTIHETPEDVQKTVKNLQGQQPMVRITSGTLVLWNSIITHRIHMLSVKRPLR